LGINSIKNSLIMNRDSNSYTFLFAAIMVFVVASSLAFTATSLKSKQDENVRKEQMQNILSTIGIQTDRDGAEKLYNEYVTQQLALTLEGESDDEVNAFKIQLGTEVKKPVEQQRFPLYVADVKDETFYIIPLRGAGLWNAIWGYIALENDMRTIKGVVFDHQGETAGLGAEITQQWFQDRFVGEKITDANGTLVGIAVSKTNNDPLGNDKDDHEVDAISGATITGDGVTDMISERLAHYTPYFKRAISKPVEEIKEETSTEEIPSEEAQTIAYQN
jgi:Na+-transporting NADH:ubiquinone oxidoreductase subunit C